MYYSKHAILIVTHLITADYFPVFHVPKRWPATILHLCSASLCISGGLLIFLVAGSTVRRSTFFFLPLFNTGHPSAVSALPLCCFGPFLINFNSAVMAFEDIPLQFKFHVDFTDWINPISADISSQSPPSSNWTPNLRYTSCVRINTLFLIERHFCYSSLFCPNPFTCFFHTTGNTRVRFDHATKHDLELVQKYPNR